MVSWEELPMLVYIIDAFNLAHKIPQLNNSSSIHTDLINYIHRYSLTGSKNNKAIIVFDGNFNPEVKKESQFQVLFSSDKSADDIIKNIVYQIKTTKKPCAASEAIVVTDDRSIRDYAKTNGVPCAHIKEFLKEDAVKNKNIVGNGNEKEISYPLQQEITEEMRKIWLAGADDR